MRYNPILSALAVAAVALVVRGNVSGRLEQTFAVVRPEHTLRLAIQGRARAGYLPVDDWVQVPANSQNSSGSSSSVQIVTSRGSDQGGDHPQRGDSDAPVTITEYSDYQCPYCRKVEGVLQQVFAKYGNQVRLVYMDFPLSFHHNAMGAAIAARCAEEQGEFWQFHDAIFSGAGDLSTAGLKAVAEQLRLNTFSFDRCLDEKQTADIVESDIATGKQNKVNGTPDFFINQREMGGVMSFAEFESAINDALRQSGNR